MQDIVAGFLYSVFTEATSTSSVHFIFLSGSKPEALEGWSSLRLELEIPTFSYHLSPCPVKILSDPSPHLRGHVSVSEGSRKPSASRPASQSLQ